MRFLVTGVGGPAGVALINQLSAQGHMVCGVDMEPITNPRLDVFATVPKATDPAMIESLRTLLDEYDIDVLIPTVAEELTIVAAEKEKFSPTPVVIGAADAVTCAHDKYLTMQRLQAAGVSIPDFALPSDFPSFQAALSHFGGVFALKPRVGRGGRGFRIITKAADLDWASVDDSMILQEFAPGAEYAPIVFVPRSSDESVVAVVKKDRHGTARVDNEEAPEVARLAKDTVKAMGLVGPIDIDVRMNKCGVPVVLEVNARFGANSEQAPEILKNLLQELSVE